MYTSLSMFMFVFARFFDLAGHLSNHLRHHACNSVFKRQLQHLHACSSLLFILPQNNLWQLFCFFADRLCRAEDRALSVIHVRIMRLDARPLACAIHRLRMRYASVNLVMYRLPHEKKNYGCTPNLDFNPLPTRFNFTEFLPRISQTSS